MKEQTIAVQRMQEYIETHLEKEITMADLARASQFSPWHSYRMFRQYTNLTPTEYIRRLRLSKSALRLKNENCRVTDAAYDLGFGSVDGYQRAFFREFGCNPGEYARTKIPITLFIPYGVKFKELRKESFDMKHVQSVFIQLHQKPERKVIIKRGTAAKDYFAYCEEVGCDVWGLLTSMDSLCKEPVCLWLAEQYKKPGTSTYVQGVEVEVDTDYDGAVPEGFDVITLLAAEYLVFQGEPFLEENYNEAIVALEHAMNKYDPKRHFIRQFWGNAGKFIRQLFKYAAIYAIWVMVPKTKKRAALHLRKTAAMASPRRFERPTLRLGEDLGDFYGISLGII